MFVVGAARSGTTFLAEKVLSADGRVSYIGEADFVWRYGQVFSNSDLRLSAGERECRYIRGWFEKRWSAVDADVVIEKTPANCLRVPLLRYVFPEARVIHLIRDGRAVAYSAAEEWRGIGRSALDSGDIRRSRGIKQLALLVRRKSNLKDRVTDARSFGTLIGDSPRVVRTALRVFFPGVARVWGPRIPGWRALLQALPLIDVCGLQWECCTRMAELGCRDMSSDQYLRVRYEDLVARPWDEFGAIYDWLELKPPSDSPHRWKEIVNTRAGSWRDGKSEVELDRLTALLGPTLRHYGYSTD